MTSAFEGHRIALTGALALGLWACAGNDGPAADAGSSAGAPAVGAVALVDAGGWTPATAEGDPFDDRPAGAQCDPSGLRVEAGVLEVETDTCPYVSAVQPSLAAVRAGDTLRIASWHLDLYADPPAEGHIAVALDGEVVWERRVPIPSAAEVFDVEVTAPSDAPAGAPVVFHVHNHGLNAWRLLAVEVLPGGGQRGGEM